MKKIFVGLLLTIVSVCAFAGFVGCSGMLPGESDNSASSKEEHTHSYEGTWQFDENGHWLECDCGEKAQVGEHVFEQVEETVPTCTEKGLKTYACQCKATKAEEISETGHSYETEVVEPTKTEEGYTEYTCGCGDSYQDSYVDANSSVGFAYEVNEDGTSCTIVGIGDCLDFDLYIPSKLDGYTVTAIGERAFFYNKNLVGVTLGDSITSIGASAFAYCSAVTNVTLGDGLLSIGASAFTRCSAVTNVTLGDSITSIGDSAFSQCNALTSVTLPDSLVSVGSSAFSLCSNLTTVNYTGSIEDWCNILFASNNSNPIYYAKKLYINGQLLTDLVIPDTVTEIKPYAFYYCQSLTSVTIGNGVTSIGDYAFYYCSRLTSVKMGNSVTSIGNSAFNYCNSLLNVALPNGISEIGSSAFSALQNWKRTSYNGSYYIGIGENPYAILAEGSKTLASVVVHPQTEIIYASAFKNANVTSIELPAGIKYIGSSAFYGCNSLNIVKYAGSVADWCAIEFFGTTSNPIYYAKKLYINNQLLTDLVVPDTLTEIKPYAFYYCESLKSVMIPDSVASIGAFAFSGCNGLTSVTIGNGVTSIGNSVFSSCSKLTNIALSDSVVSIGASAFANCNKLQYNEYDNGYYLGNATNPYFVLVKAKDTSVSSCIIHENAKMIYHAAFRDCNRLESVAIPNGVISIGDYVFSGCSSLPSVVIPDSVLFVGSGAFEGCTGLTSMVIGAGVVSMEKLLQNSGVVIEYPLLTSIIFKDANGWKVGNVEIESEYLSDPVKAIYLLTDEYGYSSIWTKD